MLAKKFDITEAQDGLVALKTLSRYDPKTCPIAFVFMDYNMPVMSGCEATVKVM